MAIKLDNLVRQSGDDAWAQNVLQQNRVHDDVLDREDIELRFGKTATDAVWPELEDALLRNDRIGYETALQKLSGIQKEVFVGRINNRFAPLTEQLKKIGMTGSDVNLPYAIDQNHVDQNKIKREDVANLLAHEMAAVFESEFGKAPPSDFIALYLSSALCGEKGQKITAAEAVSESLLLFGARMTEEITGISEYVQTNYYAPEQFFEYHQSAELTELEKRYGFDIRVRQAGMDADKVAVLNKALDAIHNVRPQDLALLKTLHLTDLMIRNGGIAHPESNAITLQGPFGPAYAEAAMPGHYAVESQDLALNGSVDDFLLKWLAHELGHLVAYRDGRKEGSFDIPADYEALAPEKADEWFAEDYSIFLISKGERIALTTIAGQSIPHPEERLAYFREHYPLSN